MDSWCEKNKDSFNSIWKTELRTSSRLLFIERFIRMGIGIIKKCRMKNLSTAKKSSRRGRSSSKNENEKIRNQILRKKSNRKDKREANHGDFLLSSHKKGSMMSREEESEIGSIAIVSRKGSPGGKNNYYNTEGNQFDSLKDFRSRLLDASIQNRELPKVPSDKKKYQTEKVPRSPRYNQKKRKEFDFKFEEFKMNDFLKTEMNL